MLFQDTKPSPTGKVNPLIYRMKPYVNKIKYKGSSVDSEISLYENDKSLVTKMDLVINHYFALSVVSFGNLSNTFHTDKDSRFDRSISGHEHIVYNELTNTHKIHCRRQLLIGDTHADFYLPAFHICIEPSSANYFARSKRARSEEYSDFQRKRMRDLYSLRIEKYSSTRQDLKRFCDWMKLNRKKQSLEEVKLNFYSMACQTLPFFISHESFSKLIHEESLKLIQ